MAIRSVFYTEVVINGQSACSTGPSSSLTDREAISSAKKTARQLLLPLDHSRTNNVMLRLFKGDATKEAAYTIEAVRYPSRRGVEIFVSDNLSCE